MMVGNNNWRLSDWLNAANVYCIQRGRDINSDSDYSQTRPGAYFYLNRSDSWIQNYYTDTITFGTGNHVSNFNEGQWMSYLFAHNRTDPKGYTLGDYQEDPTQNILWGGVFEWFMNAAKDRGILNDTGSISSDWGNHDPADYGIYHEADAFMSYSSSYQTPRNNAKTISVTESGSYCRVGPLNVTYTSGSYNGQQFGGIVEGKGSQIKVYDKNGKEIPAQYWNLVNGNGDIISVPSSNTNFYIRIQTSIMESGTYNGIGKITFNVKDLRASSNFILFYNPNAPEQFQFFLIVVDANTSYSVIPITTPINKDIQTTGNMTITKKDRDTDAVMQGVGFQVYYKNTGQYVTGVNPVTYGSKANAKTFTTGSNGRFSINKLKSGDYQVIETTLGPNTGYALNSRPVDIAVSAGDTATKTIYNDYQLGHINIVKKDASTGAGLEGVEFKIYSLSQRKYVVNTNPMEYGDINSAKVYRTNSSGSVTAYNLLEGNYQVIETSIGDNYGYVLDSTPHNVSVTARKTAKVSLTNEYKLGSIKIIKKDKDTGANLRGVGFKIYSLSQKKYITATNPVKYGDVNNAKVYYTGSNGTVTVSGLWAGSYQVIESTLGDNYGYELDTTPHTKVVTPRGVAELTVYNEYKLGNLEITKKDETSGRPMSGVGFKIYSVSKKQYIKSTDPVTYGNASEAKVFTTNSSGKILINRLWAGKYQVIEVSIGDNYGYVVDSTPHDVTVEVRDTAKITVTNRYMLGNLKIIKQDQDNHLPLEGIGFIIYNKDKGKYIVSTDPVVYGTKEQAKEYKTNSKGEISIPRLWEGNYQAIETSVGDNWPYEVDPNPKEFTIVAEKTTTKTIYNRKKYVNLNGYVWIDRNYDVGKISNRNDLYKDNTYDKNDILKQGITVKLKEVSSGRVLKTAVTDKNGNYSFKKIEIDKLSGYTIEFTYDGLIYQNVAKTLNKNNGSKAVETTRTSFNNKFAYVEAGSKENQAAAKNSSNNTVATVDYTFTQQTSGRIANIKSTSGCDISADTKSAGYTITYDRKQVSAEVNNINLGIYERRQADLAIQNELEEVKVEIGGYGHIYKYGPSYDSSNASQVQNSWNLGVRFENPYKDIYKRPVYRADAEYTTDDKSQELKMALTYKITVANQETLNTKVNEVVDYFDSRYTLVGIGTGVDSKGNITGRYTKDTKNTGLVTKNTYREGNTNVSGYKKVEIGMQQLIKGSAEDTTLDKTTQTSIYIQFNLSRENILEMLNEGIYEDDPQLENKIKDLENKAKNLKNTTEILSFTTYSDSQGKNLYAAVDKDSIPGNATVGNFKTYEDDTDKASTLAIVLANARSISGTVFEDLEDENLSKTQNISEGNAQFDASKESKIGGVKVKLIDAETEEDVKIFDEQEGKWTDSTAETVSNSDGSYTISGFIPGRYKLKFIWGDGSYKIVDANKAPSEEDYYQSMPENYKSTVINYARYKELYESADSEKFYRKANESNQHLSYAVDNIETRKQIDENFKEYSYESVTDIRDMTSTTPTFEINVEYNDDDIMSITYERVSNRIAFNVKNIDFGIIRRPVQKVNFIKTLSDIRITLANGQVLIDGHIDKDGNLTGQVPYLTYIPPIKENGITVENGFLKIEMDASLLQGSTVDMKYRLTTENTSQADYVDDAYGYYIYGESYYKDYIKNEAKKEQDVLTISPTKVVDYLDEKSIYQPEDPTNKEYLWRQMSISELEDEGLVASNVTKALEDGKYEVTNPDGEVVSVEELDEKQIYTTDYFFVNGIKFKPKFMVGNTEHDPEGGDLYIVVTKVINSEDDANFQNQAEIIEAQKGGGKPDWTPGNYIPNGVEKETDDAVSVETSIVPSTGIDKNYVLPVTVLIVSFALLGIGIFVILVKVVKRKFK